jgi:hypothetical protein
MKDEIEATRDVAARASHREAGAGSSAVAHLIDSLMPVVHLSGPSSMSRLGSRLHSR